MNTEFTHKLNPAQILFISNKCDGNGIYLPQESKKIKVVRGDQHFQHKLTVQ